MSLFASTIRFVTGFHTSRKSRYWDTAQQLVAVFLVVAMSLGFFPAHVQAATYSGKEEVRSHQKITLQPGKAITYTIKFTNTGSSTWRNDGTNFVAAATIPNLRTSNLAHDFWEQPYRAGRLVESAVAPGQTGTFRFALQAPEAEGDYTETFQLVARNLAWIEGTQFTVSLQVRAALPQEEPEVAPSQEPQEPTLTVDYPVRDARYKAKWIGGDKKSFTLQPGEQKLVYLEMENVGSLSWKNTGSRFVSLYTVRPNYHNSPYFTEGPGWMSATQIRLSSESVGVGEQGKAVVMLQAPQQPGTYTDHFRLASENYTWIDQGEIALTIVVPAPTQQVTTTPAEEQEESDTSIYRDESYAAKYLVRSHKTINLRSGEYTEFQIGFKNIGSETWKNTGKRFVSAYTIEPNYRKSRFSASANHGWISGAQVQLEQESVAPGEIGYFRFRLTAPKTGGEYTEKFRLAAEDYTWIQGGEFSLTIHVDGISTPIPSQPNTIEENGNLGPLMRVGLYESTEPFVITTDSPFEVRLGSGQVLGTLAAREPVTVSYNPLTAFYTVTASGISSTQSDYVTIQALDTETISEILSLEKRVPWNQAINENTFRGSIEIRHSQQTGKTWAINVLPMEHYLRGIAETSSSSPVEFLKVMSVAARTYAMYHYERQTKHADEHYYVDSQFDQVYRGYSLEQRHPSLKEAVIATAGKVVEYNDSLAITPYFSQSDGRTRDWSEVWGGVVEWCRSVSVPHDVGKQLLGHGVGMSARGGLLMVANDGLRYDQVLTYFFSGVIIDDRY